ncbi:MAG: accessory factor UbiK family protein [Gammaproteobacteria bacterium]
MQAGNPLEEIVQRLGKLLPDGSAVLKEDVKKNIKAVVSSALARMDLVTREEFDVQAAVLARSRARLEALERQVQALEQMLAGRRAE